MTARRLLVVTALVTLGITVQVGLFSSLSLDGVVPDVALLVVIGAALVRGPEYAALLGFAAGLTLDLAPPADHTAGRSALAFVVVGYLVGLVRQDARSSSVLALVAVACGAFVATSLFALSGLVLGDQGVSVDGVVHVIPLAVLYDILLTPLVLPLVVGILDRLEPSAAWQ